MSNSTKAEEPHKEEWSTRRNFVTKASLALAGLAAVGTSLKGLLYLGNRKSDPINDFPGEDSIFHPREDPRIKS